MNCFKFMDELVRKRPLRLRVHSGKIDSEQKCLMRSRPLVLRVCAGFIPRPSLTPFLFPLFSTFLFLLSSFFFTSCTNHQEKLPAEIIQPDSMVQILADFYLAEALASEAGFDQNGAELRKSFYKYIIRAHSTDHQRLRTSIDYYSSRPEQFSVISEKVIEELSRRQAKPDETSAPI